MQDTHTASVPDLTSLARHDSLYEEPYSPTVAGVVTSPDDTSPGPTEADTPESPDTPTSSIPIPARNTTSVMASAASASSLATSFCSTSVPRDFPANEKVKRLSKKTVHASSPDMYVCNIQDAGLQLVEYRDLSDQLVPFYSRMLDEVWFLVLNTCCAATVTLLPYSNHLGPWQQVFVCVCAQFVGLLISHMWCIHHRVQ